jgi:hypothetical protein
MIKLQRVPDNIQKKAFRKLMETIGTRFNIEGHSFAGKPTVFEVSGDPATTTKWIGRLSSFDTMNIGYIGDTKMDLYTFDMMGGKTTATIKFAEVTIISSPVPVSVDMEVKEEVAA